MNGMQAVQKNFGLSQAPLFKILAAAVMLGVIFVIAAPSVPFAFITGLDSSWVYGINMGHSAGMIFGRDIVFTYGPLGYLIYPVFPEAEPWAVFTFDWGIALLTAYALWALCRRARHWTEACLYLVVFWVYMAFALDGEVERVLAAIIALTLLIARRWDEKPWSDLAFLFVLAAVTLLAKFNLGVIASIAAFYLLACLMWRERAVKPAAGVLLLWIPTLVGLYWALDARPERLIAFLRYSMVIASSYSQGMALAGPLWVAVAAVLSCVAAWVFVPLAAGNLRRVAWGMPLLIAMSFLCFKSAMVRQDGHALPFQFQLGAIALLIVTLSSTVRTRIVVSAFAVASLGLGIAQQWQPGQPIPHLDRLTGVAALTSSVQFLQWPSTVVALQTATERALGPDELPAEFGPYVQNKRTSAYPWEIAMIRANHLRWQPLPVIQAYSAYTPELDDLNAAALESAGGPQAILLEWNVIDAHQPFYETPRSWRAMLNWYDLALRSHNWTQNVCVLNRRTTPRFDAPVADGSLVARWDQEITLPALADDEGLLMDADTSENVKGLVKRLLFRAPTVEVRARLHSGFIESRRVIRSNLRNGVLVSDWPNSLGPAAAMMAGPGSFTKDRVVSIRLHTYGPEDLERTIRIRWWRMKLRRPVA